MRLHNRNAELYGTKQVAEILGIPEWRVKNFTEGEAYRLPPAHRVGSGRGSRRLYDWSDIFRIGLAEQLVKAGFTAEAVGQAVREVPESTLAPYGATLRAGSPYKAENLKPKDTPILQRTRSVWRVVMAPEAQTEFRKMARHGQSSAGVFAINLATVCDAIFRNLERFWAGDPHPKGQ